jgi:hypothetical protein
MRNLFSNLGGLFRFRPATFEDAAAAAPELRKLPGVTRASALEITSTRVPYGFVSVGIEGRPDAARVAGEVAQAARQAHPKLKVVTTIDYRQMADRAEEALRRAGLHEVTTGTYGFENLASEFRGKPFASVGVEERNRAGAQAIVRRLSTEFPDVDFHVRVKGRSASF